ncbi:MAG: putative Ig domain-containing protein [Actinobacteria bacterium]|nr:putative Ig domain-containing protein [Actinomycetota bacterium]
MSRLRRDPVSWATGCALFATAAFTGGALGAVPLVAYPPQVTALLGRPISVTPGLVTTGAVAATVTPALPLGLAIDATTGVISGAPMRRQEPTVYAVSVTDEGGSASASFTLDVAIVPSSLAYPGPVTATSGVALSLSPRVEATGRTVFRVAPSLPTGLIFARATGAISGSARGTSARRAYRVTMTDANGETSARLVLTVAPRVLVVTTGGGDMPVSPPVPRPTIHLPVFPGVASGLVLGARLRRPLVLRDRPAVDSASSRAERLRPRATPVVRVVAATQRGTFVWLRVEVPGKAREIGWVDRRRVTLRRLPLARWDAIVAAARRATP